jgi:peptide deformylase
MRLTIAKRKYGVGLAAPQVGKSVAISIIAIKTTPTRPNLKQFEAVIINPEIIETFGYRKQSWEGCVSAGGGNNTMFARVPRYKKIKLRWYDEQAKRHEKVLDGIAAHVAQHEVDHLRGILFVDRVKDTKSYMMMSEYKKRFVKPNSKKAK